MVDTPGSDTNPNPNPNPHPNPNQESDMASLKAEGIDTLVPVLWSGWQESPAPAPPPLHGRRPMLLEPPAS